MHNHFYILDQCFNCGKERDGDMNIKSAMKYVESLGYGENINRHSLLTMLKYLNEPEALDTCDKPELKPGYVPEESLEDKLMRSGQGQFTWKSLANVAEYHFEPIIEEARKEGEEKAYKQRYGQGIKFYVDEGKRQAIAEIKERFDKLNPNGQYMAYIRQELFGPDPKA